MGKKQKLGPVERFLKDKFKVEPAMAPLVMTYGTVAILGVLYGVYWVGQRIRVANGGMSDAQLYVGDIVSSPAVARVDGDGVEDYLIEYHGKDPYGTYLGAFNGATGKLVWRSGPFHRGFANTQDFAVAGPRVVVFDGKSNALVLDVTTGKTLKQFPMEGGDRGQQVCATTEGGAKAYIDTRAKQGIVIDLGALTAGFVEERPAWCTYWAHAGHATDVTPAGSATPSWALTDGTHTVAMIGTALTALAADSKPLWSQPLAGKTYATQVDFAGARVVVASGGKLQAFDAASGRQAWSVPASCVSLQATPTRVYLEGSHALAVYDAATGKHIGALGGD